MQNVDVVLVEAGLYQRIDRPASVARVGHCADDAIHWVRNEAAAIRGIRFHLFLRSERR
jgi:hypothetical protein